MLGDLLGEERGDVTTQRVLSSDDGMPAMEMSFQASGKILGLDAFERGTYTAKMQPDGTMSGQGQGILMTPDGQAATWTGQGVGRMTANGGVSYRGALFYRSASPGLQRLNGLVGVFEYEVDAENKTLGRVWEWK